jgi:hypothetical protein
MCYPSTQTHKETREIREGEKPRERPSRRETKREERPWASTQVCDSGGQNQNPARQCDSDGAQADFRPIVEDPRVAGGPISVAVVRKTLETRNSKPSLPVEPMKPDLHWRSLARFPAIGCHSLVVSVGSDCPVNWGSCETRATRDPYPCDPVLHSDFWQLFRRESEAILMGFEENP